MMFSKVQDAEPTCREATFRSSLSLKTASNVPHIYVKSRADWILLNAMGLQIIILLIIMKIKHKVQIMKQNIDMPTTKSNQKNHK